MSQSQTLAPSRGGTLKKKNSLKRGASLKRSSSRKSLAAGSVKSLALGDKEKYEGSNVYSAFYTPVPTKGQPTEVLASRFQDWRRVLKDLVTYFREVQKSHEARSKSLLALSNLTSNMPGPTSFLAQGGISDAIQILKEYHKKALTESNKAKQIEEDVIMQLTGLRGDLSAKIKEIKSLSGDFKNSVDKEMESTRKAVKGYQEALSLVETDPHATSGKGDPFIIRLGVERQIDRQIDEENYLHKAFLNLESSGRDLESIVVGEIQKAYNAYAGILKREADESFEAVENLRTGPVVIPKDHEWSSFVTENENFVDPALPIRQPELVHFPGKDAPAAAEVRAGMLERKSKYLKSYTPGWYALAFPYVRLLTPIWLKFPSGTSFQQHTYTNSSPPTGSPLKPRSCLSTFKNRNLALILHRSHRRTSSCSKDDRVVECIVVTAGSFVPSHTIRCWHGTRIFAISPRRRASTGKTLCGNTHARSVALAIGRRRSAAMEAWTRMRQTVFRTPPTLPLLILRPPHQSSGRRSKSHAPCQVGVSNPAM